MSFFVTESKKDIMDTPHISEEAKKLEKLTNWLLAIGIVLLMTSGLFFLVGVTSNVLPYSLGTVGVITIAAIGIAQMLSDKSQFRDSNKEKTVRNKWHTLMDQEAKMLAELHEPIQKFNPALNENDKGDLQKTNLHLEDSQLRLSETDEQLEKNLTTLNSMSALKEEIQISKDRLLLRQLEYVLKLDELERRLVIGENGISLV